MGHCRGPGRPPLEALRGQSQMTPGVLAGPRGSLWGAQQDRPLVLGPLYYIWSTLGRGTGVLQMSPSFSCFLKVWGQRLLR